MSNPKIEQTSANNLDRPSENIATKNPRHAPWYDDSHNAKDKAQHRRHHGLFEDLMN